MAHAANPALPTDSPNVIRRSRLPRNAAAIGLTLLAAFYFAIPNARPDFGTFNAHDSESYLALAHSLVHGRGYTRSLDPMHHVPHTVWAPGLPVLLMPAVALSGERLNWTLAKWTIVVIALGGIVCAALLVARVTQSSSLGLWTIVLLGLNPYYWYFSHRVMIEVPLTAAMFAVCLLVDRVWAGRKVGLLAAVGTGLVAGLAMLIRGHAIGLALAPLMYLVGERKTDGGRRAVAVAFACYLVGFCVPYGLWTARCAAIPVTGFDSMKQAKLLIKADPNAPDSPTLTPTELALTAVRNLRTYGVYHIAQQTIPGLWSDRLWQWKGSGVPALAISLGVLLATLPGRRQSVGLHAAAAVILAMNAVYAFGGNGRFWLPFTISVTVLCLCRLGRMRIPAPNSGPGLLAILLLSSNLGLFVHQHELRPYNLKGPWTEFAALVDDIAKRPITSQGVLTPNEHAFQLTTGIPAPMRVTDHDPVVEHVVLRSDRAYGAMPPGAVLIRRSRPWEIWQLPAPTRVSALQIRVRGAGD